MMNGIFKFVTTYTNIQLFRLSTIWKHIDGYSDTTDTTFMIVEKIMEVVKIFNQEERERLRFGYTFEDNTLSFLILKPSTTNNNKLNLVYKVIFNSVIINEMGMLKMNTTNMLNNSVVMLTDIQTTIADSWPPEASHALLTCFSTKVGLWQKESRFEFFNKLENLEERVKNINLWEQVGDNAASYQAYRWYLGPEEISEHSKNITNLTLTIAMKKLQFYKERRRS